MNSKETQMQQGLNQLRTRILVMSAAVGIALDEACAALENGNTGQAVAVVNGDAAIDAMENSIDELALSLLVRHQPVAQDLRLVVGALRLVVDLERIGDEAAGIAGRAALLREPMPEPVSDAIRTLMAHARELYRKTEQAFRSGDSEEALELARSDAESTRLEVEALQEIMKHFCNIKGAEKSSQVTADVHGILICRSLNRVCGHAANLAEHVYFIRSGVNIKHQPLPE
ncbi:MAG: phosphate signaling complex protein PhoU [Deltaproteobacteria bacterium]|jgi:phosphate transport system protein|nr:phosphate signaling complex protein PhoU [Deltaproteobacteria bacterium]